ncbi:ECF transporter S component [Alkalibacterium sp. f15]|uniref:ECF transporter S component n=1 Tax=Alkalibacterium sp. f15 TaxID=3414029 RepID=UPI003BF83CC2
MSNSKTKKLVGVAMLASLAWVISLLSFPVLPGSPFLKVDFSDLAVLFGMYVYGPVAGITIAFIRSLLSYAQKGGEMGFPIGDTAAFIATVSYTLPIYFILIKYGATLKDRIVGIFSSTLSLTVVMSVLNWLVIAPAYIAVMGFDVGPMRTYLMLAVVPFNLIKGILVGIVFYVAFAKMKPWLDKTKKKFQKKRSQSLAVNETN